ncbi:MAG: TetR/AcrR family transcriptional regulator [Polyangiaceae bacterium]|nr:TetR/AcrR family transcriptional regulator [Polyangiaceae bacterium]
MTTRRARPGLGAPHLQEAKVATRQEAKVATRQEAKAATRQEAKAATRQALLAAAAAELEGRGFAAVSVADIAARAGVATGTFYVHFPTKEAVADELLAGFSERLAERLAGLLLAPGDLEPKVRRAATAFLAECEGERAMLGAYLERARGGLDERALRDGVNPPAQRLFAAALQGLGVPAEELELAVHALLALWMRVALRHVWGEGSSRARAASVLTKLTLGAARALVTEPRRPARARPAQEKEP